MKVDMTRWPLLQGQEPGFLSKLKHVHVMDMFQLADAIVVTKDDDVFTISDKKNNEKWSNHERNQVRKIDELCGQQIKSFDHSSLHCSALSEDGRLFKWGHDSYVQLGHGSRDDSSTPKLVQGELSGKKVDQVACGFSQTLALTDQGQVFIWGWNWMSQLDSESPKRVTGTNGDVKAVAVACTDDSSFALFEGGRLYAWYQLRSADVARRLDPVLVYGFYEEKIKQIVCGYAHCLARTDSGRIYALGQNNEGQLGTGDRNNRCKPVLVSHEFRKAVQIAAFNERSAAEFEDGTVRAWGELTNREREKGQHCWFDCANIDQAFAPKSMWRTLDLRLNKTMAETLGLALNDLDRTKVDVSFQVSDKLIWAHEQVLMHSSVYFHRMFQSHWVEHVTREVKVDLFDFETFSTFLEYLYTAQLDRHFSRFCCLRTLADYYCHDTLRRICDSKSKPDEQCEMCKRPHEEDEE